MDHQHSSFEANAGSWHHLGWRVLDARTYWVSHPADGGARARRASEAVGKTIKSLAHGEVWEQSQTLYVFNSYATIDYIAWCLRSLRKVKETLLVGSFTHQECRILGPAGDPRIFDLIPFAKSGIGRSVSKPPDGSTCFESEEALQDFLRTITQDAGAGQTASAENGASGAASPLRSVG